MRVYQKHAGDDAKLLIKFHCSLAWPDRFFSARRLSIKIISACSKKAGAYNFNDKRRAEKKQSGHARLVSLA